MRKTLLAVASFMTGRPTRHRRRHVLGMAAALLWVGLAPPAAAADSIGPGSPVSNTPVRPTYTTTLGILLGINAGSNGSSTTIDQLLNGSSTTSVDQLLADITKIMRDTEQTSQAPRPTPRVDTLVTFVNAQLKCIEGITVSCSSATFVPGDFASGIYAMVIAGCAKSLDPNVCVSQLGQIDISCISTLASVCSTPGAPVVNALFASATSVLEVRSYNNGSLRIFVPAPVAPGGGGISAELPNAVPEPATWAMMLIGFGVVGAVTRSRHRRIAISF